MRRLLPLGPHWEHSPQKLFMMIRAGRREEVLRTDAMGMCTWRPTLAAEPGPVWVLRRDREKTGT
jgi:hypothetical protein